jgi:hypothetical protein
VQQIEEAFLYFWLATFPVIFILIKFSLTSCWSKLLIQKNASPVTGEAFVKLQTHAQ